MIIFYFTVMLNLEFSTYVYINITLPENLDSVSKRNLPIYNGTHVCNYLYEQIEWSII